MKSDVWHHLEISRYEGIFEIWIDGNSFLSYTDPKPLPEGYIHLSVGLGDPVDPESVMYYDDFVICELTAPFESKPTPEP
jgi:hypothetical protein